VHFSGLLFHNVHIHVLTSSHSHSPPTHSENEPVEMLYTTHKTAVHVWVKMASVNAERQWMTMKTMLPSDKTNTQQLLLR